jgi:hypothetical protein
MMRFCRSFWVDSIRLIFTMTLIAGTTAACGSDTGSASDDASTPGDDTSAADGTTSDADVTDSDVVQTPDSSDDTGFDVEPDGDGLIPSGPDPGPTPDPGALPRGYSETPPAGADPDACVTGQWWAQRDRESELMHPGGDCTSCHTSRREGPRYAIAGTVMADYAEAEDCRGVDGPVVEIYGADGTLLQELTTNSAGNFFSLEAIPAEQLPYTARVIYDGRVRRMLSPQTTGQCNSCHTATGLNSAPGRIVLP